ncbi:MAG: hypothetical protein L3J21_09810 [Devosiaceae bacterium]|nr:hypothetical protein [Devosiaceae bacterium]
MAIIINDWIDVNYQLPKDGDIVDCKFEEVYPMRRNIRFWKDGVNINFGLLDEHDGKGSRPATHWRLSKSSPEARISKIYIGAIPPEYGPKGERLIVKFYDGAWESMLIEGPMTASDFVAKMKLFIHDIEGEIENIIEEKN